MGVINTNFVFFLIYLKFIYFALDEITDNLVVKVLNRSPLDALLHILLL